MSIMPDPHALLIDVTGGVLTVKLLNQVERKGIQYKVDLTQDEHWLSHGRPGEFSTSLINMQNEADQAIIKVKLDCGLFTLFVVEALHDLFEQNKPTLIIEFCEDINNEFTQEKLELYGYDTAIVDSTVTSGVIKVYHITTKNNITENLD